MPVDYQHHGTGLLRATAETVEPSWWPDPTDAQDCRTWLSEAWSLPGLAMPIRHASPVLAGRVEAILTGDPSPARDVQRVTLAVVRCALPGGPRRSARSPESPRSPSVR
ncbi:hypothetical protein FHX42_001194 [Saccharopolyspora lacisalsi]|uniref:Uncharacterized protein n=1 Tax=Halosaccharopolyspora lacisalsi TaxID=1000566 RepID=A0A839DWZ1_9PSEU|nr:hypothetical protein [Halosaccharopolyspora lacisalsi]MBA8823865.1 hypothetical protein [Halosaccharopolyspora lacisalsi]